MRPAALAGVVVQDTTFGVPRFDRECVAHDPALKVGMFKAAAAFSRSLFERGLWGRIISCTRMLSIYLNSVVAVGEVTDTIRQDVSLAIIG